eukprot:6178624-Pleurochrysis_carterae.AAC.6
MAPIRQAPAPATTTSTPPPSQPQTLPTPALPPQLPSQLYSSQFPAHAFYQHAAMPCVSYGAVTPTAARVSLMLPATPDSECALAKTIRVLQAQRAEDGVTGLGRQIAGIQFELETKRRDRKRHGGIY